MRQRNATSRQVPTGAIRWRWAPGLFSLLVVLLLSGLDLLAPIERWSYRQTLHYFAPQADNSQIVVLTLSPNEIDAQGLLASTLGKLTRASAVAVMLPLSAPENRAALSLLDRKIEQVETTGGEAQSEPLATLHALARELDSAERLSAALRKSANVILTAPAQPEAGATTMSGSRWDNGETLNTKELPYLEWLPGILKPVFPGVRPVEKPYAPLLAASRGLGLSGNGDEVFPSLYATPGGDLQPSLALQLLRLNYKAISADETVFSPGDGVRLASQRIATDSRFYFYPFVRFEEGLSGLNPIALSAVAAGAYPAKRFSGKTVFIGLSGDPVLPRQARAAAALLQQQQIVVPGWSRWGQYAALLTVTLFLMFLLPRMGYLAAAVTVLLATLLLINGEFLLLLLSKQWLPLMLPLLLLWLGYPLIAFRRFLSSRHERLAIELSDANRQLGRMLQSQGDLELALEKYRRCRVDGDLLEQLYHLGLDFERKRQFSKAVSVFRHLDGLSRGFRDVAERIERNQSMEQRIVLAKGGAATAEGTVIMSAEGLQNPTVGHYQIERELGRGAMGMVYLGKDPRIGRAVAIKTMALSSEFEGAQLDEVRQRFYREAETAGRLNHPNIVHIYDIGEEQELAYIAMDYLRGEHLGHFTEEGGLLPVKEVLGIVEKVAEALEYAHKQSVVHRDIKPANIIYDSETGSVKVTDFGVACLTDSSKTKTGTVLGSPSYMSPEQVAGKRVDGRADIFSLGVTLYQMVTAHLPFTADSLGSLMYKITNEPHPKPSKYRKGLPACVSRIINKCMQKDPQKRYQSGGELAAALKRCREK